MYSLYPLVHTVDITDVVVTASRLSDNDSIPVLIRLDPSECFCHQ